MKSTGKPIIFLLTFLALTSSVNAQSPREQLNQMVQQLQKTPSDNALRERIIKLGAGIKPAPALPDTAVSFEGRAQFAFRSAKSENDFLVAAQEYEKAVAAAPWVPGYYSDLCTIYEKAGRFEDAKRNCGFFLASLNDPAQMTDTKRRIAGLEFGIEKANSPAARAESQKQRDEELVRGLDGAVWLCWETSAWKNTIEVRGRRLFYVSVNKNNRRELDSSNLIATLAGREFIVPGRKLCNPNVDFSPSNTCDGTGRISETGGTISFPTLSAPRISGDGTMGGTVYGKLRDDVEECRRVK